MFFSTTGGLYITVGYSRGERRVLQEELFCDRLAVLDMTVPVWIKEECSLLHYLLCLYHTPSVLNEFFFALSSLSITRMFRSENVISKFSQGSTSAYL